jgi:hypothetical protein
MYENDDVWPVRCPHCDHGFTAKIGHLKRGAVTTCVSCSNDLGRSTEEFYRTLSAARNGKFNPWWDMLKGVAQHSPGPDVAQASQTPDQSDCDLVDEAFTLFLCMDPEQRVILLTRQQHRMAKDAASERWSI